MSMAGNIKGFIVLFIISSVGVRTTITSSQSPMAASPSSSTLSTTASPPSSTLSTTTASLPSSALSTTTASPPSSTLSTTTSSPPSSTLSTTTASPPSSTLSTTTASPPSSTLSTTIASPSSSTLSTTSASPPSSTLSTTTASPPSSTFSTTTASPPSSTLSTTSASPPSSTLSTTLMSTSSTQPPTTPKPEITKKELLEQTDNIIQNVTDTLDQFSDALTAAISTTIITTEASTTTLEGNNMRYLSLLKDLIHFKSQANEDYIICTSSATDECKVLEDTLNAISNEFQFLTNNVDQWTESRLENLKYLNANLTSQMGYATEKEFIDRNINVEATLSKLEDISQTAENAKKAVNDKLSSLDNGIIFAAVFGSIGGLIIVTLIAGTTFAVIKSKRNLKEKSKKYKQVSEENVPIDGFLNDHDNMAFVEDESAQPKDIYPLKNLNQSAAIRTNPYSRPESRQIDDLYAKPSKSRIPKEHSSPRNTSNHPSPYESKQSDNYYSRPDPVRSDGHYSKPSSSTGDKYYSRQNSSKSDYYAMPNPSKDEYYDERNVSKHYDAYSATALKDSPPRGGLRRFNQ